MGDAQNVGIVNVRAHEMIVNVHADGMKFDAFVCMHVSAWCYMYVHKSCQIVVKTCCSEN
jgi:hypothetical protein